MFLLDTTDGTLTFAFALKVQTAAVLMLWFYGTSLFAGAVHASLQPRQKPAVAE